MAEMTTDEAAAALGLSRSQIQHLCREYSASEGARGLAHRAVGTGRHRVFLLDAASVTAYGAVPHRRGWPKGRRRSGETAEEASG